MLFVVMLLHLPRSEQLLVNSGLRKVRREALRGKRSTGREGFIYILEIDTYTDDICMESLISFREGVKLEVLPLSRGSTIVCH